MSELGYVEAFARLGAKLANPQWAVSAIADDGALVVSCWHHLFRPAGRGVLVYEDRLSRWSGSEPGNALLRRHLERAVAESLPVRAIVATAEDSDLVDRGSDASTTRKTFHIPEFGDGRVSAFDGDRYVIEFRKSS